MSWGLSLDCELSGGFGLQKVGVPYICLPRLSFWQNAVASETGTPNGGFLMPNVHLVPLLLFWVDGFQRFF